MAEIIFQKPVLFIPERRRFAPATPLRRSCFLFSKTGLLHRQHFDGVFFKSRRFSPVTPSSTDMFFKSRRFVPATPSLIEIFFKSRRFEPAAQPSVAIFPKAGASRRQHRLQRPIFSKSRRFAPAKPPSAAIFFQKPALRAGKVAFGGSFFKKPALRAGNTAFGGNFFQKAGASRW